MEITTRTFKSGSQVTTAMKENGNQTTFRSNGMTEKQILEYATEKLNYEPFKRLNLANILVGI